MAFINLEHSNCLNLLACMSHGHFYFFRMVFQYAWPKLEILTFLLMLS